MTRLLPHPLLTIALTLIWAMLWNDFSGGTLAFGLLLGVGLPLYTSRWWPGRPRVKNPAMMAEFLCIVLWDILKSNLVVAKAVVFRANGDLKPAWISIPLDLTSPEAITLLAGTITMTPGTLSAEITNAGSTLLIHCLDAPDPDAVRDEIKTRYEARIKEMFE